jgi:hypothetical protein
MAFLFQDQNQGIRNDAPRGMRLSQPFSFIRTLTVGFGIAPNLLTLPPPSRKALAGLGFVTLTAGGEFHPALRTSAVRDGRPSGIMTSHGRPSKRLGTANQHVPMPPWRLEAKSRARKINDWGKPGRARGARNWRAGLASGESDSGLFSY